MSRVDELIAEMKTLGEFVTRHEIKKIWPPEYKFIPPPSGKTFTLRNGMPSYEGELWHEDIEDDDKETK